MLISFLMHHCSTNSMTEFRWVSPVVMMKTSFSYARGVKISILSPVRRSLMKRLNRLGEYIALRESCISVDDFTSDGQLDVEKSSYCIGEIIEWLSLDFSVSSVCLFTQSNAFLKSMNRRKFFVLSLRWILIFYSREHRAFITMPSM